MSKKVRCWPGLFVTIEGADGVGKSTFIKNLHRKIGEKWPISGANPHLVVLTREPGGTPGSEKIRSVLRDLVPLEDVLAETSLMLTARRLNWLESILPALKLGKLVICDRFRDSTYAYQSAGRSFPEAKISALEKVLGLDKIDADITFILSLDRAQAATRRKLRATKPSFYDVVTSDAQDRIEQWYQAAAVRESDRCHVLDATWSEEELVERALDLLGEKTLCSLFGTDL